jgi:hypothetical protein
MRADFIDIVDVDLKKSEPIISYPLGYFARGQINANDIRIGVGKDAGQEMGADEPTTSKYTYSLYF